MQDKIEEIKSKIDIVEFLGRYITLKKAGRNFKALCPFHQEKTPSFIVSPERQIWHCFGACHEGGDIIKFLMKWENISFWEAVKILAKEAGVELKNITFDNPLEKKKERIAYINTLATLFYKKILNSKFGTKALNYLIQERKLNKKVIDEFELGWAPKSWDAFYKFAKKRGISDKDLLASGLVIKGKRGLYDRFRERIVFPLKNTRGTVIGLSGRLIKEDKDSPKYINVPETVLYRKRETLFGIEHAKKSIQKKRKVIIVEGEFDMLSPWQRGIDNIVAIKGSALTEEQITFLKRIADVFYLMLDMDKAGEDAIKRAVDLGFGSDIEIRVVKFEGGKDPDELAKKNIELFKKAVKNSEGVIDFIIDRLKDKYQIDNPFDKKRFAEEIIPYLLKINNPIIKDFYLKKVSNLLKIEKSSLLSLSKKISRQKKSKLSYRSHLDKKEEFKLPPTESFVISYILRSEEAKKLCLDLSKIINKDDFSYPSLGIIFDKLKKYFSSYTAFDVNKFILTLTPQLKEIFDSLYLSSSLVEQENTRAFKRAAWLIKKDSLKRTIKKLLEKNKNEEVKSSIKELKKVEKSLINL